MPTIEPILLAAACIHTFEADRPLTNASGFFFERDARLFLVTSRHVLIDEPSGHFPDRIEIELHTDPTNLAESTGFSMPLYRNGRSVWRQGLGKMKGIKPSSTNIKPSAASQNSSIACYCALFPEFFRYLKNAELGSITITSFLSLKVCL